MTQILMPLATGFEETEAVAVVDVLRRAKIEVVMASVSDLVVVSARQIRIVADAFLDDINPDEIDGIILPGGEPGTTNLEANSRVTDLVKYFAGQGKLVAAICAAPRILNRLGVLKGIRATSFPETRDSMDTVDFVEDSVVQDGNFITSRGAGTSLEFGISIVRYFQGAENAQKLAARMLI